MVITDNGCGIPQENLTKIFAHGFTTKPNGNGFSLHSCGTYIIENGGKIWTESNGPGTGQKFTEK